MLATNLAAFQFNQTVFYHLWQQQNHISITYNNFF